MDLKLFRKLCKVYSGPLPKEVWQTAEYESYLEAINFDKECADWYLKQRIREAGLSYKKYCCVDMAYRLIEDKKSKRQKEINYDSVVIQRSDCFGLPIHDGGNSCIPINYCPWCGSKLSTR